MRRLRHAIAVRLAPWLDHPNLRGDEWRRRKLIPVLVTPELVAVNGGKWGNPCQGSLVTLPDGTVDMCFRTLYDVESFRDAWADLGRPLDIHGEH